MTMNPTALMKKKGAIQVRVARIRPNRMNPNEMPLDTRLQLETDMRAGDYDPITVSPLHVFYHEHPELIDVAKELVVVSYVICDGEHRHKCAQNVGLETIWCYIEYWSEKDAMAHFYKRQRLRGALDPLKEAELFGFEIKVNRRSKEEVITLYNIPSSKYLETRLEILDIIPSVAELFYNQGEYPGRLSISHLVAIARLPAEDQYAVALTSLEMNWSRDDVIGEVRRIKEGRGTRQPHSSVAAPEEMPESRPTQHQRGLHPKIDRLLRSWEEDILRYVKGAPKPVSVGDVYNALDGTRSKPYIRSLLREMIESDVLELTEIRGGPGRPKAGYAWKPPEKALVEPRPEPEQKTDEEIFESYSAAAKVLPVIEEPPPGESDNVTVLVEQQEGVQKLQDIQEGLRELVESEPVPATPGKHLTMEILVNFMDKVFKLAVAEDFELLTKKKIDGREPDQWLVDELSDELDSFIISQSVEPDIRALAAIALKACQVDYRLSRYDDKPKEEAEV